MSNRVAIYKDGQFVKFGPYPRADLSEPVGTSDGTDFRIERRDEVPTATEEQRVVAEIIHDDGPDAEFPHLKVRRVRYNVVDFTLEEAREFKLYRLIERYEREQSQVVGTTDSVEIDFRIAILPVVNLIDRSTLSAAQRQRFNDEVGKAQKLQANKANASALRAAINSATTIQDVRAVDLTQGWAA